MASITTEFLSSYAATEPGAETRKTFRDWEAWEREHTFFNTEEFGTLRTVEYDGSTYRDIPVLYLDEGETLRQGKRWGWSSKDRSQGLFRHSVVLYVRMESIGGKLPKQGSPMRVAVREKGKFLGRFSVLDSTEEMGVARIHLEEMDE